MEITIINNYKLVLCSLLVLSKGFVIHAMDEDRIHYAAKRNDMAAVQKFIEQDKTGKIVHEKDYIGRKPLHYAAWKGSAEMVCFLYQHGADINCQDICGLSPLHYAAEGGSEKIVQLLYDWGACINQQDSWNNSTPLHRAVGQNKIGVVALLCKFCADLNLINCRDFSPLRLAAQLGNEEIVRLLCVQKNIEIDGHGLWCETPLLTAVSNNHGNCVRLLLNYGANPYKKSCTWYGKHERPIDHKLCADIYAEIQQQRRIEITLTLLAGLCPRTGWQSPVRYLWSSGTIKKIMSYVPLERFRVSQSS